MKKARTIIAGAALALALAACGEDTNDDKSNGTPAAPARQATHQPGSQVDAEDYVGPPQPIVTKRVDEAQYGTKKEQYCKTRKANGTCKKWATRDVKYVKDDKDWVLVLADGTEVDVDEGTYNSYKETQVYPR